MIIGERLRTVRQQKKLSQADLERRTGIPQRSISTLENNLVVPKLKTLERLAKGLRVPVHLLFCNGNDDLNAGRSNGRKRTPRVEEEAGEVDQIMRLFKRVTKSDQRLLVLTALQMDRRRSTSRPRN